jgi:hypothetical protein
VEDYVAYTSSLGNFVSTHREGFLEASSAEGTCYWLALCVAEAHGRDDHGEVAVVPDSYSSLVDDVCSTLADGLRGRIPKKDRTGTSGLVDATVETVRQGLTEAIAAYRADYLCPAFRAAGTANTAAQIEERLRGMSWPAYEEPDGVLMSKTALYARRLRAFAEAVVTMVLFEVFVGEVRPRLERNRYWGYMKYYGESMQPLSCASHLLWPARIRLRPDRTRNEVEGWTRAGAREPSASR